MTQRWIGGAPRWRAAGEPFQAARYEVAAITETEAAGFIATHHYQPTMPSTSYRFGLFDHGLVDGQGEGRAERVLVGVLTLGVPMNQSVLTRAFPTLEPYTESLDFNRLVLLDAVPGNAESFFTAAALRLAAEHGVRGVVTYADPQPRWRTTGPRPELIKPGHVGIVYQALNFLYAGRATRRTLVLLPDATVLSARAMAKVTGSERGAAGVIARLVDHGAPHPDSVSDTELIRRFGPPATEFTAALARRWWLRLALHTVQARRVAHPGNHRYLLRIGTRAQRTRTVIGLATGPYPKPVADLALTWPGMDRLMASPGRPVQGAP
jgi:hypothetical protein